MKFGDTLLTDLLMNRKRHRGTFQADRGHDWDAASPQVQKKKKHEHENLGERLAIRASRKGVEREMFAATKGHTCFKFIGDMRKRGAISNFIRKLMRLKNAKQNREIADKRHKEMAQHL